MSHSKIDPIDDSRGFYVLLAVATVAFLALTAPLYAAIFWAIILAVIGDGLHDRIHKLVGERDTIAALLSLFVVVLVIVLPALLLGVAVTAQFADLVEAVKEGRVDPTAPIDWLSDLLPVVDRYLGFVGVDVENLGSRLSDAMVAGGEAVASQAVSVGKSALRFVLLLGLALYLLFFFFRDGSRILSAVIDKLPLEKRQRRILGGNVAKTVRATVKGIVVMGVVQGTIAGLAFALLGFERAILLGVATAFSSVIPAVGTALIWAPVAVGLFVAGETVRAVILVAVGTVVIGSVDNLLRPIVVGRDARMPDYIVLVSTLGGLALFGISGFVMGPLIAAVFLACWSMYGQIQVQADA